MKNTTQSTAVNLSNTQSSSHGLGEDPVRKRRSSTKRIKKRNVESESISKSQVLSLDKAILPGLILLIAAIPFGAVHPTPQGLLIIALGVIALLFNLFPNGQRQSETSQNLLTTTFYSLTILTGYIFLQSLLLTTANEHPLESLISRSLAFEFWRDYFPGLAVFSLSLFITSQIGKSVSLLNVAKAVLYSSYILALIGLAHWFNDNGRLFWYFSPTNVIISPRVRWPLVNSNHFGFMLLPGFILSLAFFKKALEHFHRTFNEELRRNQKLKRVEVLGIQRTQLSLGRVLIYGIGSVAIAISLTGSLSRAVWAGTLLAISAYSLTSYLTNPPAKEAVVSRKRNKRLLSAIIITGSILFTALSIIILFLGVGAGQERVLSRLAYGLLHTHNDMRFQLYEDSWQLLSWFGIGTSQWKAIFPKVMSEGLAGINAVYLHSDPLQFLIEYGVIGGVLLLPILALPLFHLTRVLIERDVKGEERELTVALFAISIGLILPLAFDFPLRIPANLVLIGALYGLVINLGHRRES